MTKLMEFFFVGRSSFPDGLEYLTRGNQWAKYKVNWDKMKTFSRLTDLKNAMNAKNPKKYYPYAAYKVVLLENNVYTIENVGVMHENRKWVLTKDYEKKTKGEKSWISYL